MVNREIEEDKQFLIQKLIRESLLFARENPGSAISYMRKYAQEMREDILLKHVETFVNEYSLSLGAEGREAVKKLLALGSSMGLFPLPENEIFVSESE